MDKYLLVTLLILSVINLIHNMYIVNQIKISQKNTLMNQLSEYEIDLLHYDTDFENRIEDLKSDLKNGHSFSTPKIGNYADELDENVHNLPHSIIDINYEKEEVAE